MSIPVVDRPQSFTARTYKTILADSGGDLPTRIEIMRAGTWPSESNKGALTITTSDLHEFKQNFDNGVGMPGGAGFGLPIDFEHEYWGKAGAWMKGLVVEGDVLYADPVEWSTAGKTAVEGGEYKCISPMFTPACLGEWHDPENWNITARNVLEGAALTNIPFFKGLTPITADRSENDPKNVIYVNASQIKEISMTLEDVRVKANADLNDEERAFILENKAQLNADELSKFGLEAPAPAPVVAAATTPVVAPETPVVTASAVKGDEGIVRIEASELKGLNDRLTVMEASVMAAKEKEVRAEVATHVARGAIVADSVDKWAAKIMADDTTKELLESIPDNSVMAAETGKSANTGDATVSAATRITDEASKLVAADSSLDIGKAISMVMASNADLAREYELETKA